ncbi:MAG: hypothetical protein HY565_00970 [Candidatus Kerfeldbacteria bacterium]|nr:hypothetical protein [Candidatus Kerfeldbacteria bacterium]
MPTPTIQFDRSQAQRLAFLLAQSVMPEEQKVAWLNLLPLMSQDQISRFMSVLEQEHGSYQEVSKALLADLEQTGSEMNQALDRLAAKERQEIEQYVQKLLHGTSST